MQKFSYLNASNAEYIDEVLARYLENPDSIDPSWRYFFEGLEIGVETTAEAAEALTDELIATGAIEGATAPVAPTAGMDLMAEARVAELIQAYRELGHQSAQLNPLSASAPAQNANLALSRFGLTDADLSRTFQSGKLLGLGAATLSQIVSALKQTYCTHVAAEFSHMQNREEREWLLTRMEGARNQMALDAETRKFILQRLTDSETFERFLHTRYVAQKRFSGEGNESVIPMLDCMIETAAESGTTDFVLGMAHRGRLNVLVNTFQKKLDIILTQFEGKYKSDTSDGEGDVKYHMGWSHDHTTRQGKKVHLSMGFNPSHLEFVNPVVEGMARAKQTFKNDTARTGVIPVLIHGDAALAGQGVCYETLNFTGLKGFGTGGTIHIAINNQVGFTTFPWDSRTTQYCTDIGKASDSPIFHVNGDQPEAAWFVAKLATEFRQKFKKDVYIDLVCYRKHGHNEGEEPSFTQPLMYKSIKAHPSTRELYAQSLASAGVLTAEAAQAMVDGVIAKMTEAQTRARAENPKPYIPSLEGRWKGLKRGTEADMLRTVETAVPADKLRELATQLNSGFPASFHLHSKLPRFFEARLKAWQDGKGIDWGNGESLAFATLVDEGVPVRITGQDSERGTFTHRHSVLTDSETGEKLCPLNHLRPGQARYDVHNSHLSETGVLGFEYGYSLADPMSLVIWEAQFGDFANGAQVIIDQFIATGESKWKRSSGLVLLLPHGYEGQGPEHSSARLERFLQLCGRANMSVCNLTTPAQLFHALRRQVKRDFRKPLVIMSPKSLLRHPMAISSIEDFSKTQFQEVLDDAEVSAKAGVKRVLLCSGKVYYDLVAERAARKATDTAIIRIEQLFPLATEALAKILGQYPKAELVWVQEEPRNMGAWTYLFSQWAGGLGTFSDQVGGRMIRYVGRDWAASPAVGSHKLHEEEQKSLTGKAYEA